ncbi:unannotated protein [freshwater metagenome]|uniref:Unannotated protein n=1 Tax=freshwater metagenome TaxID=449393 RepID=A0A6J7L5J1_9ZZZZ
MANRKFARRNHTFGLVTDIEKYFVSVNFYYDAFDEVTVIEELQGLFDCC